MRYKQAVEDIDSWQREMEEWRIRSEKITQVVSDMPRGGKALGIDDIVAEMDEILRKTKVKIKEAKIIKLEIEIAVARLEGNLEKVLRYRYINRLEWNQIAVIMGYEVRQIYRIHGKALNELNI